MNSELTKLKLTYTHTLVPSDTCNMVQFNSLAPRRCKCSFIHVKTFLVINSLCISWNWPQIDDHCWQVNIGLINGLVLSGNKSFSQCWPSSMMPYDITRGQCRHKILHRDQQWQQLIGLLFDPAQLAILGPFLLTWFNSLRLRQNGRHFADDTFKRIFLNENVGIWIKISLKFVHKGPVNNITALVQIMAWRRPGDKPLSEPMVVRLPTHICVTRPQWVNFDPSMDQYITSIIKCVMKLLILS